MHTIPYGEAPDQAGDLHLPTQPAAPLLCLFHGGFWRMPYGRDQLHPVATALASAGFAVWNLGYRRVGAGGAPWPATFDDVRSALRFIPQLSTSPYQVDLQRVVLVGHSAGGHLAFWGAAEAVRLRLPFRLAGVVGLAPLLDLVAAARTRLGDGAAEALLGGPPDLLPDRYRLASPQARLPLGVRQIILHGEHDEAVPARHSRAYTQRAAALGDDITYVEIRGADHMTFLDPTSYSYGLLLSHLSRLTTA
ncbi:MAG TPA: alpha/beta hydrolase [Gemmatimonadales bacterium]|nr:alpha/beta hydrolase [Gemmatimonadales bacterium]